MIQEIISTITEWLTGFWTVIASTMDSAIGLFWDETGSTLTVLGILALFSLAVGLVYLGLNFVLRMLRK